MNTNAIPYIKRTNIRLLPRHDFYLHRFGYADDDRLARLFREAWAEIPLGGRRSILKYWRALPIPVYFEALDTWSGFDECKDDFGNPATLLAACRFHGSRLSNVRFWAPAVDAMPDAVVKLLVQHELAHIAAFGYGRDGYDEDEVCWIVARWGFDDDPLSYWDGFDALLNQLGMTPKSSHPATRHKKSTLTKSSEHSLGCPPVGCGHSG